MGTAGVLASAIDPILKRRRLWIGEAPHARIVNLSSVGSLTENSDRTSLPFHLLPRLPCLENRAQCDDRPHGIELESTSVKVNAVSPGYTKTALNDYSGTETVERRVQPRLYVSRCSVWTARPVRSRTQKGNNPVVTDVAALAQQELSAFFRTVSELYGKEQAQAAAENRLQELSDQIIGERGSSRVDSGMRKLTIAAASQLASR